MRETMFFILGLMLGGTLGVFIMCALSISGMQSRIEANSENDEVRR